MEKITINGVLKLKAYKNGVLIWSKQASNLIVANGYDALLNGLIGTADKYIEKVQIGTNPVIPISTNTVITSPIDLAITNTIITTSKLTIEFELGSLVGNGTTFAEFGLILKDGSLFSRKSWEPFLKIQDLTINGTWEINI